LYAPRILFTEIEEVVFNQKLTQIITEKYSSFLTILTLKNNLR